MSTEKAARLVHRAGRLDNSMISQDVVSAAERHKNAAPGASPGYRYQHAASPEGAKDSGSTLSPLPGLGSTPTRTPGSRPGLCSYAAPRQKKTDARFDANKPLATKRVFLRRPPKYAGKSRSKMSKLQSRGAAETALHP